LVTLSTAGLVLNSATTAATNNLANAIVARDASGAFSAGTITGTSMFIGANRVVQTSNAISGNIAQFSSTIGNISDTGISIGTVQQTVNNVTGLTFSWASATTILLSSGLFAFADGTINPVSVNTINIATNGVNGLDTGSAANNTSYYVIAIYNPTSLIGAGLFSVSPVPTLPSGYTSFARLGMVRRNATGSFLKFVQTGTTSVRQITYTDSMLETQVLTNGHTTAGAFAAISLASYIPAGVRIGMMRYDFTTTNAASIIALRETGSTVVAGNCLTAFGPGVVVTAAKGFLPFLCDASRSLDWFSGVNTTDTTNLYIYSYSYDLYTI
jgi:hypothetical protein